MTEGKIIVIEAVELLAYAWEEITAELASVVAHIAHDVELHVKQFLKLQPHACFLEVFGRLREMDVSQGLVA